MKTIKDIEEMKNTPCEVFGTYYNYMVETLFDWYIAKLDGEKRIQAFLQEWDGEAKEHWVNALESRVLESEQDLQY